VNTEDREILKDTDRLTDPEYLTTLPDHVPDGRCLVHTSVRATRLIGSRGSGRACRSRPHTWWNATLAGHLSLDRISV
jgi:hypothetical protein